MRHDRIVSLDDCFASEHWRACTRLQRLPVGIEPSSRPLLRDNGRRSPQPANLDAHEARWIKRESQIQRSDHESAGSRLVETETGEETRAGTGAPGEQRSRIAV